MLSKKTFIPILKNDDKTQLKKISDILDREYDIGINAALNSISTISGSDEYAQEYTKQLKKLVPENFCLYPFLNFQLDPDGRARPCCKYKVGDGSWQQHVPKIPEVDIGDLWDQEELQDLRGQFLRNERPSGCKACWDEEAAGIKSMRLHREDGGKLHPHATFFSHVPRTYPKTLDLKLSNLCNLKCRICTPFLSSQWAKEINDLKITEWGSKQMFLENSKEKFSANPNNEEVLKEWAPSIEFLEFYGGEPLMQQEHNKILGIVKDYGVPSNTGLYYNTNSTICKEEFFKHWASFKEVIINFSIDDIEQRFEYQRKNAKWHDTVDIIDRYQQLSLKYNVNMKIYIYATVGILNVFYLKEFLETIKQFNNKVVLNLVHYPHHYSITNLPEDVKDIVKDKLLSIETDLLEDWSPRIDNIINYMYGAESDPELLLEFFDKTKIHDQYRNESFHETFPELYELLKHHAP